MERGVGLLTGPTTHLDHLGILCELLDLPLLVIDRKALELAHKFYPSLNVKEVTPATLSHSFLKQHFDLIIESGHSISKMLSVHLPQMRFAYCPHGNSDKVPPPFSQDLVFYYGDQMIPQLKAKEKIRTGNFRLQYYTSHKSRLDSLAQEEIFSHFSSEKPVALYAPTWSSKELFQELNQVVNELSAHYNLVIKLHPFIEEDFPALYHQSVSTLEKDPTVVFANNFPAIYPILERCDLYIGDHSSIGYDFLHFDRPMYLFSEGEPLHTCGFTLPKSDLLAFIERTKGSSFTAQRKELYQHAFGPSIPISKIKQPLLSII